MQGHQRDGEIERGFAERADVSASPTRPEKPPAPRLDAVGRDARDVAGAQRQRRRAGRACRDRARAANSRLTTASRSPGLPLRAQAENPAPPAAMARSRRRAARARSNSLGAAWSLAARTRGLAMPQERARAKSAPFPWNSWSTRRHGFGRRTALGDARRRLVGPGPPRRARHRVSADLPRLPRASGGAWRACAGDAGARFASSSGRSATGSARRSSTRWARACCRGRRVDHPPVFQRARAVALFEDGPARRLVHRLKYSDRMELARPMGAWMARAGADILAEADALAPIPLHYTRLWRRQFNQAAALARAISPGHRGKPLELGLVARACAGPAPRSASPARNARENLQGAFRCPARRPALKGRRIVLIDDVLTSGATANAAARALLAAARLGRRAGVRAGVERGAADFRVEPSMRPSHISIRRENDFAAHRHLHQIQLPLLPRRQGPAAQQGRGVRGNRRRWRPRRAGRDGGRRRAGARPCRRS